VVKDTSKQKKETSINGNTESVMPCSNEQSKEENKQKSPSNYGFEGLMMLLLWEDIDPNDWIIEPIDKERGGMNIVLPNVEGQIYLTWADMYQVDVTFVHTKKKYNETVTLPTLRVLLDTMEEQRKRTVGSIRDMLKDAFKGEAPEGKPF